MSVEVPKVVPLKTIFTKGSVSLVTASVIFPVTRVTCAVMFEGNKNALKKKNTKRK